MNAQPSLTPHVTIPSLARKLGQDRTTTWRRLLTLHDSDRRRGIEHTNWLHRQSTTGAWQVNLSRLYAEHPEMFDAPTPEETSERCERLESAVRILQRQVGGLLAAFREYKRAQDGRDSRLQPDAF